MKNRSSPRWSCMWSWLSKRTRTAVNTLTPDPSSLDTTISSNFFKEISSKQHCDFWNFSWNFFPSRSADFSMIIVFEDFLILRLNVRAARSQCVSFSTRTRNKENMFTWCKLVDRCWHFHLNREMCTTLKWQRHRQTGRKHDWDQRFSMRQSECMHVRCSLGGLFFFVARTWTSFKTPFRTRSANTCLADDNI